MDIVLLNLTDASDALYEACYLPRYATIDIECGGDNSFELKIRRDDYSTLLERLGWGDIPDAGICAEIGYAPLIAANGTEFGGYITGQASDTTLDTVTLSGMTWRGFLNKCIIEPPSGSAYYTVSKGASVYTALAAVAEAAGVTSFHDGFCPFVVVEGDDLTTSAAYSFPRYCTFLGGVEGFLKKNGMRLDIKYAAAAKNVEICAKTIQDYSESVEFSQNSGVNFTYTQDYGGVNHLICLGAGELAAREVVHLYASYTGDVSTDASEVYSAFVTDVYDYGSAESTSDLINGGIERLNELKGTSTLSLNVAEMAGDLSVEIGDIIGGRDYETGFFTAVPLASKIYRLDNGTETIEYGIETDETTESVIE